MTVPEGFEMQQYAENRDRFEEIMEEIKELAREAVKLLPPGLPQDRARSYWYAHIMGAVDKENSGYLGGSMVDMAGSLEDFDEELEEEGKSDFEDINSMRGVELLDDEEVAP